MELTEAQAAHFDAFGFLKLRAFSDGEVRAMVAEAEAAEPACSDPVERSELLTALMVTRLLPAMRRLLGEMEAAGVPPSSHTFDRALRGCRNVRAPADATAQCWERFRAARLWPGRVTRPEPSHLPQRAPSTRHVTRARLAGRRGCRTTSGCARGTASGGARTRCWARRSRRRPCRWGRGTGTP